MKNSARFMLVFFLFVLLAPPLFGQEQSIPVLDTRGDRGDGFYDFLDKEYLGDSDMPFVYRKVVNLADLATGFLRSGTLETTYDLLETASAETEKIFNPYYKARAHWYIANSYADFMNIVGVRELARNAALKSLDITNKQVFVNVSRVKLYNRLIKVFLRTRHYSDANRVLAKSLEEFGHVHETYYKAMFALDFARLISILTGDDKLAGEMLDTAYQNTRYMTNYRLKSMILTAIADHVRIKGDEEFEALLVDEAYVAAKNVHSSHYRCKVFINLAKRFIITGELEKGREILKDECEVSARRIGNPVDQAEAYLDIAGVYYLLRDPEGASDSFELAQVAINRIGSRFDKVKAYSRMFWLHYILENSEEAIEINEKAEYYAWCTGNYQLEIEAVLDVAANYTTLKNFDKASELLGGIPITAW